MKNKLFALCPLLFAVCIGVANADDYGVQDAWDNPEANMATGSSKPGFAQLDMGARRSSSVCGMVTMINRPKVKLSKMALLVTRVCFKWIHKKAAKTIYMTPVATNQGSDTNPLIVTGKSGNKYLFYLRSEPANSSEISYSQVDIVLDGRSSLPSIGGTTAAAGQTSGMNSIFPRKATTSTLGVDGEDYGWIKTMKN